MAKVFNTSFDEAPRTLKPNVTVPLARRIHHFWTIADGRELIEPMIKKIK